MYSTFRGYVSCTMIYLTLLRLWSRLVCNSTPGTLSFVTLMFPLSSRSFSAVRVELELAKEQGNPKMSCECM